MSSTLIEQLTKKLKQSQSILQKYCYLYMKKKTEDLVNLLKKHCIYLEHEMI